MGKPKNVIRIVLTVIVILVLLSVFFVRKPESNPQEVAIPSITASTSSLPSLWEPGSLHIWTGLETITPPPNN